MYAKKCTISELVEAMERVNINYHNQVIWNCPPTHTPHGIKFTLKVTHNKAVGHGISQSGRQMATACWHVHGNFFDRLFDVNPNAVIFSRGLKITKEYGNWGDYNVGSQMNPQFASQQCECGEV